MMAARSGKMPTTSVRRRSSLFSRSCGLDDQIWRQISRGTAVKASRSASAADRCPAAAGSLASYRSAEGRRFDPAPDHHTARILLALSPAETAEGEESHGDARLFARSL